MIEDYVCQHCADTGFVNVPFEVKEGEPAVEAFVDTREQATVKVAVKVAVAIVIGALALLGFTAFAIWSGL